MQADLGLASLSNFSPIKKVVGGVGFWLVGLHMTGKSFTISENYLVLEGTVSKIQNKKTWLMDASGLVTLCWLPLGIMKTVLLFVHPLKLFNKLEPIRKMSLIQALTYRYMGKKSYKSWKKFLPGFPLVQSLMMKSWSCMVAYQSLQIWIYSII